jgi:hypothetical protein
MDMSPAALPPRSPVITQQDRRHPRFPEYDRYRMGCVRLMVRAHDFSDWLHQGEAEAVRDKAADHPRYQEFMAWMRQTQAGRRKCPVPGGAFPQNFYHWLEGGRW